MIRAAPTLPIALLAATAAAAQALPGWDEATLGGCLPAIEAGLPFDGAGLRPLSRPVIAPEHAEWPARSWTDAAGRFTVTMIEFPSRTGGARRVCDVTPVRYVPGETAIDVFDRFLDWGSAAAASGRYAFQDTHRHHADPATLLGALRATAPNPRGCIVSVSLFAMPYEGVLSFSAAEEAGDAPCGGPSLLDEVAR